jgi:hypothetical protein
MDDRKTDQHRERNQGEGDRESARRYNEAVRETVESGEVERREQERREADDPALRDAEETGKARARERDPEVPRDYRKPS